MLEPLVTAHAISDLAEALVDRAVGAEPTIRAERELFVPLARAYFHDRERALAGPAVPLTTLMLEAARMALDHQVEQRLGGGGRLHHSVTEMLTGPGHLPHERADRLAGLVATVPLYRLGVAA